MFKTEEIIIFVLMAVAVVCLVAVIVLFPGIKRTDPAPQPEPVVEVGEPVLIPFEEPIVPLPIDDPAEPDLTFEDVQECLKYLELTTNLVRGKKTTTCSLKTAYFMVEGTKKSASTIHKRWMMGVKREGYDVNKDLSVFVLGRNSTVAKTHHCTRFGSH